jgi:hypothetical protein
MAPKDKDALTFTAFLHRRSVKGPEKPAGLFPLSISPEM